MTHASHLSFDPPIRVSPLDDPATEAERARAALAGACLLHVHGQSSWHDTVRVSGNPDGLAALLDAVDRALSSRDGVGAADAMVRDGEGFKVEVTRVDQAWDHPAWERAPLPYADPVARGEADPLVEARTQIVRLRHALREANAALVKRGVRPILDPTCGVGGDDR